MSWLPGPSPNPYQAEGGGDDPFARPPDVFAPPPGFEDDDIPTIDDAMLHGEVDFEAGMSAFPLFSLGLILACIAVFVCQVAGNGLEDAKRISAMGALDPDLIHQGEIWRLVSATFMHGNFEHLMSNMVILFVLGMACEHGFGRPQYLFLYVGAGLFGSIFSLMGSRLSVGASGAIFGLAGALIALFWRHQNKLHLRDRRIGVVIGLWAAFQIVLGLLNPNIDNLAHFGGLVGGVVLGLVLRPAVLEGRREVAYHPLTLSAFVLTSGCLAAASVFFIPRLIH